MTAANGTARGYGSNPTEAVVSLKTVIASDLWAGWRPAPGAEPQVVETETFVSGEPANFEATIDMRLREAWPSPPLPPRPDTRK